MVQNQHQKTKYMSKTVVNAFICVMSIDIASSVCFLIQSYFSPASMIARVFFVSPEIVIKLIYVLSIHSNNGCENIKEQASKQASTSTRAPTPTLMILQCGQHFIRQSPLMMIL